MTAGLGGDESETDEMFIISEPNERGQGTNLDWLHRSINDVDACKIANRPTVEWEKSTDVESPGGNSFTSSLFNRIFHRTSSLPKISSSITKMASDESNLEAESSQDAIMKKLLFHPLVAPDVDVVPMPRTEAASIKDSMDVIEQRRVS